MHPMYICSCPRNRRVVKILHYERGFYVLYEKRPVMGKFKKPVFTLWLMRLPNLSELKHRKARLTGESIYGLFCKACQVGLLSLQ